jgi:predicted DNA binding CopG/RHH family protein
MKKKLVLPQFKSEDEEIEFWDSIDVGDYFEPSDFVRGAEFPNLKRSTKTISIRLPATLIERVKKKAKDADVPYQRLIKYYIQKGLGPK